MMKRTTHREKGFTLVEVIISSFIFSILMLTVSGIFVQILGNERRAFAAQKIQENGLYVLEFLSREIRVSQVLNQESPACQLTTLTINHPVNGTVIYTLTNGTLQRIADGVTTNLSSSDVTFSRLNFCVVGSGPADQQQARIAILSTIQNKTGKEILKVNLETTVSTRDAQTEF